jgi:hypothetical protein
MTVREILEEVKRRIRENPESYTQQSFCGSQCCIAGHIDAIINGLEFHIARTQTQSTRNAIIEEIERVANSALGETDSPWLFGEVNSDESENDPDDEQCAEYWPLDLSIAYDSESTPEGRAKIGCDAIDRYLDERGL